MGAYTRVPVSYFACFAGDNKTGFDDMTSEPRSIRYPDFVAALEQTYLFEQLNEVAVAMLYGDCSLRTYSRNQYVFREGGPSDALYIVLRGRLQAERPRVDESPAMLGTIQAGEVVGEMQILAGGTRTADVRALEDATLIAIPGSAFEKVVTAFPELLPKMRDLVIRRLRRGQLMVMLPGLLGECDEAILRDVEQQIEWVRLQRGEALFQQGDPGDSFYIVVSGSLQVVVEDAGQNPVVVDTVSRGECVGEMGLLSGEDRSAAVYAVRNCDLVKMSRDAFERLVTTHPSLMTRITQILTRRLRKSLHVSLTATRSQNLAVVALTPHVPLPEFTRRLAQHLAAFASPCRLNAERVDTLMGRAGAAQIPASDQQSIRLSALLDEQETHHHLMLYEGDSAESSDFAESAHSRWTRHCIQRADLVLLVADARRRPSEAEIDAIASEAGAGPTAAEHVLVLLHPDDVSEPSGTAQWLALRPFKAHYHVRRNSEADFARLARFLTGNAVGLALSGGGARGFAHFGVYLALQEAGVPIDMVGGTSMGAVVGVQCAQNWPRDAMLRINREGFMQHKIFKQYTLPLFALINTRKLNRSLQNNYPGAIEDLWVPFLCVACNLTEGTMVVYRQGEIWEAVRASVAIPGILEPRMTEQGHLLVDGGLLNNLPVDLVRQACGTVIAVDVGQKKDLIMPRPEFPNPWTRLLNRLRPFHPPASDGIPSILDVLLATTTVTFKEKSREIEASSDLYLRPPLHRYGMLDFQAIEELVNIGYTYAQPRIEEWLAGTQ